MHSKPPVPFDAYAKHISALEQQLADLKAEFAKSLAELRQLYEATLTSCIEREQRATAALRSSTEREQRTTGHLERLERLLTDDNNCLAASGASSRLEAKTDELAISYQKLSQTVTKQQQTLDRIAHRVDHS